MKLLIVVDAQNDFITGSLGSPEANKVIPKIINKVKNYDGDIICTRDTHTSDYLKTQEGQKLPVVHCIKNSDGWKIPEELFSAVVNHGSYLFVNKLTFGSKDLPFNMFPIMYGKQVEEIELVGYDLDICVISNALLLKAFFPEIPIVVDTSCCAASSPDAEEAAKIILESCQIEVR